MKERKVKYLNTGWDDPEFESKVQSLIDKMLKENLEYYDIKISSKNNHCMLIFKKVEE